jgi:hypothetical protein
MALCSFCPAGVTYPLQVLPTGNTCLEAYTYALQLQASDSMCTTVQMATGLCCPLVVAPTKFPTTSLATPTAFCGDVTCTQEVWGRDADGHSCGARISWLQTQEGGRYSNLAACKKVTNEFPDICTCYSPNPSCNSSSAISDEACLVHKVRVQLEAHGVIMLREVQVFDQNNANRALYKHATQSSTYVWGGTFPCTASLAVDGVHNIRYDHEISHTKDEQGKYHTTNGYFILVQHFLTALIFIQVPGGR